MANHGGWGVFCGHALGDIRPRKPRVSCSLEALEDVLALAQSNRLAMEPIRAVGHKHWHKWQEKAEIPWLEREKARAPLSIAQTA